MFCDALTPAPIPDEMEEVGRLAAMGLIGLAGLLLLVFGF
jgi:hypothetical protein